MAVSISGHKPKHAAHAHIDWCADFGVAEGLISDSPTHFQNEVVRLVTRSLRKPHLSSLSYCPWSDGSVGRLESEVITVVRALLSELLLVPSQWPDVMTFMQSVSNQAPSPQKGDTAPITAFTGKTPTPPTSTFMSSTSAHPYTVSKLIPERAIDISALQKRVSELQPIVANTLHANRELAL